MTVCVHRLAGCQPEPLAAYLRGLAVLRLVATQQDEAARGWWRDDGFALTTRLDRDQLIEFFLHDYRPTPLVAPWNGGSGFYPKDKKDGIDAIANGKAARFAPYRAIIEQAGKLTETLDRAPKDAAKAALIRDCRNRWRGPAEAWLDAALVITRSSQVRFPALLGTGGNDGRLDFTNNQMQRLVGLFSPDSGEPGANAEPLLRAALFGDHAAERRDGVSFST